MQHLRPDDILCELDALETIAICVGQGLGYSVLPDWQSMKALGALQRRPLPDMMLKRELVLLHRGLPDAVVELITG